MNEETQNPVYNPPPEHVDFDEMFRIAEESLVETVSDEELTRSQKFFRPRYKSFNHIHDHRSKFIKSPLAILADKAYSFFDKFKATIGALNKKIFKRNAKIYRNVNDASIVGRLTYAQREDQLKPIHHMHLELWGRTWLGFWRKLGEGMTDWEGDFCIPIDMKEVHRYGLRPKLHLEIFHTGMHIFENGYAKHNYELFKCIKFKKLHVTGMEYNLGIIQLFYWEYMDDSPFPRVVIKDHDEDPPQRYSEGRVDAISHQFIPIEIIKDKHLVDLKAGVHLSIDSIQKDYPLNLTYKMEEHTKGITRTDEWFGERMMNGMFASTFDKDPNNPNLYWLHHHWQSYDHDDKEYALHNVTMKFRLNEEGYMLPTEIQLRGRLHKDSDPNELHILKPGDGVRWEGAKKMARVSAGLLTEIDKHFVGTHLNTEQYAIAAYRNIRKNPIGAILFPHVKEVVLINHKAFQILVSPDGYICRSTALTGEGMRKRVLDVMGTLDWKNWKPMQPLSDKHSYALAANLYYNIITEYIDEFVEDHKEEIINEWYDLFAFSEDLVKHSVAPFLCRHLQKATGSNPSKGVTHQIPEWYNESNRMDLACPRHQLNGDFKAVSRIVENKIYNPESADLKNVKDVCAYIIFHATFEHFWANSKQYDDIGEIKYCSLGIRYGSTEHGVLGPENDNDILPDGIISSQMMWWSNMLSRTGYGFIMSNEDNDIHPLLLEKLKAKEKEFSDLGVSIYDIQSRTNI